MGHEEVGEVEEVEEGVYIKRKKKKFLGE